MAVTTLGAFPGANSTDKSKRIPAAISALNKALAGDAQSLTYMRQQAQSSATAVGKDAFRRALAIYDAQKPAAAPPSTATPRPGLVPIPKPPILIEPLRINPIIPVPPVAPTPDQGGMVVPVSQPKPIGFDTTHPPLTHAPQPTVRVSGMRPGQVRPVTIGSSDGGVITSPPTSEPVFSGPTPAPLAPADFGYVAPTPAATVASDATPPTASSDNNKILLVLAAGVVLWLLVEGKRK